MLILFTKKKEQQNNNMLKIYSQYLLSREFLFGIEGSFTHFKLFWIIFFCIDRTYWEENSKCLFILIVCLLLAFLFVLEVIQGIGRSDILPQDWEFLNLSPWFSFHLSKRTFYSNLLKIFWQLIWYIRKQKYIWFHLSRVSANQFFNFIFFLTNDINLSKQHQ